MTPGKTPMFLSIRVKILMISMAILCAALGATAWVSGLIFTKEYSSALQSCVLITGRSLALQLDRRMKLQIPLLDLAGFHEQCCEIVEKNPGISFVSVIDPAGRILFHNDPLKHNRFIEDPELARDIRSPKEKTGFYEVEGAPCYCAIIPVFGDKDEVVAAVSIGFPIEIISGKTRRMVISSVTTALVFFGFGSILLMVLMKQWVSRPLEKLLAVIEEILKTGADSTRKVEIAGNDEIGKLGEAFNRMIDGLKQSFRTIREHAGDREVKIEKQLQQAQKMESIGTLAGGIAHDFNNLLSIIIGNTDLAISSLKEEDPVCELLDEIKTAGQRASGLTRQILAFSRRQIIQPQVVSLNDILENTRKMLERIIGENIEQVTLREPELRKVKVDPGQMEQVILNLVVNARDAMPDGGRLMIETANVELDEAYCQEHVEAVPGSYVMVAVTDSGIGMDKEIQAHIFEPFFTTKEIGKGTGMGLATTYGIVKQNRGYIYVYSEKGRGATFRIYLPCHEGEAAAPLKEADPAPESLEGSETVLVVEDDEMLRKVTHRILSRNGYHVLEAQNGEEALEIGGTHEGPIHLILTDVVMPGMNVREMARRMQSQKKEVKIVYMSGYTDNAIAHYGVLEDGIAFIGKPFTSPEILRKIRQVLDGASSKMKTFADPV